MAVDPGRRETIVQEDVIVTVAYADGLIVIVTYPEHGHGSASIEPPEIPEGRYSVLVDDHKRLTIDGKAFEERGHVDNLGLFGEVVDCAREGEHDLTASLKTSETMLAAAALKDGVSGQCAYGR